MNTFEYVLSGLGREGSLYDKGAGLGGGVLYGETVTDQWHHG